MHVELKALGGLELTDSLREFCEERIVRPLRRIYDREGPRLEIELSDDNGPKGGIDKRCRITFEMPHTRTINVVQNSDDIYRAVDLAASRFRRLVKRYKGWKLSPPRYPVKYYAAQLEHELQPGEAASPDDLRIESDSLAAAEARSRQETSPPFGYAGEPAGEPY